MARPLRLELPGAYYHITARGNGRQSVFLDDRDRRHFTELLAEAPARFGLRLLAWVALDNHYHLLVQLIEPRLSRAMQWLGVSYGVWFNRRHGRSGHVFQGRFHTAILEEPFVLEVSRYVHLNPVRLESLGLDKEARQRQRVGADGMPEADLVKERLRRLREFRWSSFGAYVGRVKAPDWLDRERVLASVGGLTPLGQRNYAAYVEEGIREGTIPAPWERLMGGIVLGGQEFVERIRGLLPGNRREQPTARELRSRCAWPQVVATVERLKGESWAAFRDRQGDWGRDLALWLARDRCGMTLRELGEAVGGLDYTSVSTAILRVKRRAQADAALAAAHAGGLADLQNEKI